MENEVGWLVLLVCLLVGGSLFFSLNNLALRTFSRVKLQEAFKAANKEDVVEDLIENAEKLILTSTLFRVIANIGMVLGLFALLAENSYILTFIIALLLFSIFTLAIPHSWAKHSGENILARTHKLLHVFAYLATPALFVLRIHDSLVRRLAGVTDVTAEDTQDQKQEEILSIVERGRMEGVVDEEEMEMIEGVLELGDTTAEEIMTPRTDVIAVRIDDDLPTVVETVIKAGHSRIPVYEENIDKIIGLIYAKDLLDQIGKSAADFNVRSKMRDVYFVPETKPLKSLLHEFQNQKLHLAVVLDEYGGTAGIVTIEDILEELVGEIVDEYEERPPEPIKKLNETTIVADARTYIDDLNDQFELDLPEDEDYDTLGGFVFSHLGSIPKTGETFEYEDVKFIIIDAEARKIKRVRIQKRPAEEKTYQ
ncbi:MAG TPA: HlyC/CorC family transporter [Planctomycetes bacterium]|nr:HlyC/CorC family transporter [Planctomycetota bacterium]